MKCMFTLFLICAACLSQAQFADRAPALIYHHTFFEMHGGRLDKEIPRVKKGDWLQVWVVCKGDTWFQGIPCLAAPPYDEKHHLHFKQISMVQNNGQQEESYLLVLPNDIMGELSIVTCVWADEFYGPSYVYSVAFEQRRGIGSGF